MDVEPLHTPRMKNRKFIVFLAMAELGVAGGLGAMLAVELASLAMVEAELGVAGGLVKGDHDHDCKLLLKLAFVRLFQQDFQKKNLATNEVLYFTAMEIASENVCLIF